LVYYIKQGNLDKHLLGNKIMNCDKITLTDTVKGCPIVRKKSPQSSGRGLSNADILQTRLKKSSSNADVGTL